MELPNILLPPPYFLTLRYNYTNFYFISRNVAQRLLQRCDRMAVFIFEYGLNGCVYAKEKGTYTELTKPTKEPDFQSIINNYNDGSLFSSAINLLDYDKTISDANASLLSGTIDQPTVDSQAAWILVKLDDSQLPQTLSAGQEVIKRNFLKSEGKVFGFTTEALATLKASTNMKTFVEQILHLRANKDLRVKWDAAIVPDNQFRIVNGRWEYYGDTRRVITVSYFETTFSSKDGTATFPIPQYAFYQTSEDHTAVSQIFKLVKGENDLYDMINPNIKSGKGLKGESAEANNKTKNIQSEIKLTTEVAKIKVEEWDEDLFSGIVKLVFPKNIESQNSFHAVNHPFERSGLSSLTMNLWDAYGITTYTGLKLSDYTHLKLGTKPHQVYKYTPEGTDNPSAYMDYMSGWYLEPATTIALPVKRLGKSEDPANYKHIYTSFNYPFAVEIPNGVATDEHGNQWIYTERNGAASEYKDYVLVRPMDNPVVAKETPIVMETKNFDTIRLRIIKDADVPADAVTYKSQVWKGALEPVNVPAGTYVIGNHDVYGQGFFTTTKEGWLAPNRIYLEAGHTLLQVQNLSVSTALIQPLRVLPTQIRRMNPLRFNITTCKVAV